MTSFMTLIKVWFFAVIYSSSGFHYSSQSFSLEFVPYWWLRYAVEIMWLLKMNYKSLKRSRLRLARCDFQGSSYQFLFSLSSTIFSNTIFRASFFWSINTKSKFFFENVDVVKSIFFFILSLCQHCSKYFCSRLTIIMFES